MRSQSLPIYLEGVDDKNVLNSDSNSIDPEKIPPLPFETFMKLMESQELSESQVL